MIQLGPDREIADADGRALRAQLAAHLLLVTGRHLVLGLLLDHHARAVRGGIRLARHSGPAPYVIDRPRPGRLQFRAVLPAHARRSAQ
jgi:hypothetical protein